MKMKNDCQVDYIKEAFDKLYNRVMPFIDLTQFADADEAFKELDKKVHSEIYILKKCLDESDRAVDAGLTRSEADRKRISELEQRLNNECKHGEDLADINCRLASENVDLKAKVTLLETSRITWRSRAQHAEKAVTLADINCRLASENVDLKAKVSDLEKELAEARNSTELHLRKENERLRGVIDGLEKENASLRVTPPDVNVIESLEKENSELKTSNERLNAKYKSHWKALSEARTEAALMKKENSYMRRINDNLAATCETRLKLLSEAREEVEQYKKSFMAHHEENNRLREVIDGRDNEIHELEKKIQDLEEENASLTEDVDELVAENTDLHTRLSDDAIRIESLNRANDTLRRNNGMLWAKMEELEFCKRPWHGDGNAMTGECIKSLAETIEFQNKKIEELEAEKVGKEHKENVDLSPGHEFEFGDEVFVPWSDGPYMYVKSGMMYNPRTERLVYVGKDQHLKWFGEKFSIV